MQRGESLPIKKSFTLPDYHDYVLNKKEIFCCLLEYTAVIGVISYLFYASFWAFIVFSLGYKFYISSKRDTLKRKRKEQIEHQFKDFLAKFSDNLKAGYSVENAFSESYKDLLMLYEDKAILLTELKMFLFSMKNNTSIGELLLDFGVRSDVEEIEEFAKVFVVARYSGGNLTTMIRDCSDVIRDKMEMKREIRTIIAAKEMEAKIMMCIPFFIMIYINITSPGYFNILYHNMTGIGIMSVCLLVYVVAVKLAGKIVKIEM